MALFPQQIKAYLSREADSPSLAAKPDVAELLRPGEAPAAFGTSTAATPGLCAIRWPASASKPSAANWPGKGSV